MVKPDPDIFERRAEALSKVLGPNDGSVQHAVMPLYLGGFADVLTFRERISGVVYATCDLTGWDVGQKPNSMGHFELMICVRTDAAWAINLVAGLAKYTTEARLEVGDTMDCPPIEQGQSIEALLFGSPGNSSFTFRGERFGLLLVTAITGPELAFKRQHGSGALMERLKAARVMPYSDLRRASVV